jgi:hypothetical protein
MERKRKVVLFAVLSFLPLLGMKQFQVGQRNFTPAASGPLYMYTGTFAPEPANTFTGAVGATFVAATPNVKSLCRYNISGNSQTHVLALYDLTANTTVATASVNLATGTPGTWQCASITPVTLVSGDRYAILSCESSGGDSTAAVPVPAVIDPAFGSMSAVGVAGAAYSTAPGCPTISGISDAFSGGLTYGPVNLTR